LTENTENRRFFTA